MRVFILTPRAFPKVGGNAVTAERWRRLLLRQGHEVVVAEAEGREAAALAEEIARFSPDLVHIHHLYRGGAPLIDPAGREVLRRIPFVASTAGTDINCDAKDADKR